MNSNDICSCCGQLKPSAEAIRIGVISSDDNHAIDMIDFLHEFFERDRIKQLDIFKIGLLVPIDDHAFVDMPPIKKYTGRLPEARGRRRGQNRRNWN